MAKFEKGNLGGPGRPAGSRNTVKDEEEEYDAFGGG
jgi:hypothetical protein